MFKIPTDSKQKFWTSWFWRSKQKRSKIKVKDLPSCTLRNMPIPWPVPCPKSSPYCQRGLRASVSNDEPENQTVILTGQLIHYFHILLNGLKSMAFLESIMSWTAPQMGRVVCSLAKTTQLLLHNYLGDIKMIHVHVYTVNSGYIPACGNIWHLLYYIPLPSN